MRIIIATLGAAAALAAGVGLLIVNTGMFNVSTSWEDPALVRWALITTRENSIKSRAAYIETPMTTGAKQVDEGFRSYREMCAVCHTPPGAIDSPITKGLNPVPPDLAESAEHMSSAELFWAIKNGIRMTGMPGWGITHKDKEMWDIVAFLKTLPDMKKEDYEAMGKRLEGGHSHSGGGHEGGHGDTAEPHSDAGSGHAHGGDEHPHDDDVEDMDFSDMEI